MIPASEALEEVVCFDSFSKVSSDEAMRSAISESLMSEYSVMRSAGRGLSNSTLRSSLKIDPGSS